MSGKFGFRNRGLVFAVLTFVLAVSLTACQSAPSKSKTAESTPIVSPTPSETLSPCPVVANWPVKPVAADVLAVVTKYYAEKNLTPVTIYNNEEMILDVKEQSVGTHSCRNADGGLGGYVGAVPLNATAAVMVYVKHKPYPTTQTPSNFVTLAQIPGTGWTVVGEGTGP